MFSCCLVQSCNVCSGTIAVIDKTCLSGESGDALLMVKYDELWLQRRLDGSRLDIQFLTCKGAAAADGRTHDGVFVVLTPLGCTPPFSFSCFWCPSCGFLVCLNCWGFETLACECMLGLAFDHCVPAYLLRFLCMMTMKRYCEDKLNLMIEITCL